MTNRMAVCPEKYIASLSSSSESLGPEERLSSCYRAEEVSKLWPNHCFHRARELRIDFTGNHLQSIL